MEDDEYEQPAGVTKLSKTRWTVCAICFERILENYDEIMELWCVALRQCKLESEVKSRIIGCQHQMETFFLFFGLCLGKSLYKHSDNLSKTLQSQKMCALSSYNTAMLTVQVLEKIRNDIDFDNFFNTVVKKAGAHSFIEPPVLQRKRKPNPRYDYGNAVAEFPATARDNYRRKYYEALDLLMSSITSRFSQPSFKAYENLETLLLNSLRNVDVDDQVQYLKKNFDGDISPLELSAQLPIFRMLLHNGEGIVNFHDVLEGVKALKHEQRYLISSVVTICKLILVNPATTATAERSFSLARRLLTWLQSKMGQKRFNSLALLHFHKDCTDAIDVISVANDFVTNQNRARNFGKFTKADLQYHQNNIV